MKMLSTGEPSTLGNWLKLTRAVFGDDNAAVRFLESKIAQCKRGADEEVPGDESQMLYVMARLALGKSE